MTRRIASELLLVAGIGVALAGMGPFGTYGLPPTTRLTYWVSLLVLGYAIFRPLIAAGNALSSTLRIPRWGGKLMVITVGAAPLALLATAVLQRGGILSAAPEFPILYFQVWIMGAAIAFLIHRLFDRSTDKVHHVPAREGEWRAGVPPKLFKRLPSGFGPRLLCLSMEDHYVRVHGERGTVLLLLRLRDAVEELSGIDGLQVHRSWWVASDAMDHVERDGRRVSLVLTNGMKVPVAQPYLEMVRHRITTRAPE